MLEPLETINERLERNFGRDLTGRPYFRIVWSEDQLEKRRGTYTDYTEHGIFLREVTEVREVPKYRQWIQNKYVLEGLTLVPVVDENTLPTSHVSYEPLWVFEDRNGNPLPPKWEAAEFILNHVRRQMQNPSSVAKYQEGQDTLDNETRWNKLEEQLFGNETPVGDALAHGYGVSLANTQKES